MAKILLIDDSNWWLKRMSNLIQKAGHEVRTENGFNAGLRSLDEHQPDCIITDLLMPDGDGFQILNYIRQKDYSIPVIVLTADFQEETIAECKELGAFEVLQKERVKTSLENILSKALKTH